METWHPFAVHLPITLILLWPIFEGVAVYTRSKPLDYVAIAVGVVAIFAAVFATATGQAAFDAALARDVSPDLLNSHASDANLMPWLLIIIAAARFGLAQKFGRPGRIATVVLGFVLAGFLVTVGQSGGALVFEHGVGVQGVERLP